MDQVDLRRGVSAAAPNDTIDTEQAPAGTKSSDSPTCSI